MTSSSTYPATLDTFGVALDGAKKLNDAAQKHSEIHDWIGDALNKIEAELGVNPAQAAATVAAFLAAIPIANLAGYPADATKVPTGDGTWQTLGTIGLGAMDWTPYTPATITGWATAERTVDCSYLRLGTKTVFVSFDIYGDSNAATAIISCPALGNSKRVVENAIYGVNNGTKVPAVCSVSSGASPYVQCNIQGATITWTATGDKEVWGQIIYELA
jgi:hypothetical protein